MENPTETTLTLSSGRTFRVLFSGLGMLRADEEYGYVGARADFELDPDQHEEKVRRKGFLRVSSETVWIGVLTFELISYEEFMTLIQTTEDFQALGACYGHMLKYQMRKPRKEEAGAEGEDSKKDAPSTSQ